MRTVIVIFFALLLGAAALPAQTRYRFRAERTPHQQRMQRFDRMERLERFKRQPKRAPRLHRHQSPRPRIAFRYHRRARI